MRTAQTTKLKAPHSRAEEAAAEAVFLARACHTTPVLVLPSPPTTQGEDVVQPLLILDEQSKQSH